MIKEKKHRSATFTARSSYTRSEHDHGQDPARLCRHAPRSRLHFDERHRGQ